jgi:CBS domain-containing protein
MKTASIALRIADFLKRHPPFSFLAEEALVELAAAGRVKLHEVGEVIFTTGQPRDRFVYVINQGRVRVENEAGGEPALVDLRGPGEMLGLQGLISEEPYINAGIAETDVLLYALPRTPLAQLLEHSPRAQRYLAAYFSLNAAYDRQSPTLQSGRESLIPITLRKGGLFEVGQPQAVARESLLTVRASTPGLEAAHYLCSKRVHCVIVVDEDGCPLGKITDIDLRDRFLEGRILAEETAGGLMKTDLAFAKPHDDTGKLLVRMTRSGKRFLVVTEDGTARSRTVGLVTERNIFLQYGRFPTLLGEAMLEAPDYRALRALRDRMEALILEFLEGSEHVPWLMEMTGVLNRALTARVLRLTEASMKAEGWSRPGVPFTWLMMGSGGRDELLVRSAVYHALMYADPEPDAEEETGRYFRELARRATEGLRHCGFLDSPQGILASEPGWCLPESAMRARYSRMIANPAENMVYTYRDAFDFRPVIHRNPLAVALRAHIHDELGRHPECLRQMARDSLLNQPPRTLFQHYVVDEQGVQKEELEIKHHALLPLVDAARVLALANRELTTTSTHKRFLDAAGHFPDLSEAERGLFREASEAFVLLAFARAQQGLRHGTDGAVIRPADLDPETRPFLKTAFRTILSTLEWIEGRYDLKLRT